MLTTLAFGTAFSVRGPAPFARRIANANVVGPQMSGAYDFSARDLKTNDVVELSKYKGKVSLVVNVASKWGLTDANYKGMVALTERYSSDEFAVLAFPCNQFGGQEPGTPDEILAFAGKYGATFPMFEKIDVNGPNTHPLFKYLKSKKGEEGLGSLLGNDIKWNFAKFLVGQDGEVLSRYAPTTSPEDIEDDIKAAIKPLVSA